MEIDVGWRVLISTQLLGAPQNAEKRVKGDTGPSADPVPLWDPRFLAGFDPKNSFTFFSFGLKPFTPNPTSLLVLP